MTEPAARPTILFNAHPLHLFLASAYFYCWELGSRFDVVLLVPRGGEDHPGIRALLDQGRVRETVAMPSPRQSWALHRWAARTAPRLLARVRPVAVVQSNFQYHFNKSLFRAAGALRPAPLRIVYLSGVAQRHVPVERVLREVNESHIISLGRRLPLAPPGLARALYRVRGAVRYHLDHAVLPLLLTGRPLAPTLHETAGRIVSRTTAGLVDAFLCYGEADRQALLEETDDAAAIHLIEHPATAAGQAVCALAIPAGGEAGAIVALPSRSYDYERLDGDAWATEADRVADLWAAALDAIRARLGARPILWKLHPGRSGDPVMARVTQVLAAALPGFTVIPPARAAEDLICAAGAVVGDTSTAIVWAARLGGRPVFSLDLFDVPGGAEMERYPGITMVRGAADLARLADLEPTPPGARQPALLELLPRLLQQHQAGATAPSGDWPTIAEYQRCSPHPARLAGGSRTRRRADRPAPRLSVITICRNAHATLDATIDSVLGQDLAAETEYILVDGQSQDGTLDIVRRREGDFDQWLSEPDAGISDAFNKGIALARGAYVAILNADDRIDPDYYRRAVAALDASDAAYAFGDLRVERVDGTSFIQLGDPDYARHIHRVMPRLHHPTVVVRRTMYERYGLFRRDLRFAMDYEFLLRLHRLGQHGVHVPGSMATHRQGGVSHRHYLAATTEMRRIASAAGAPGAAWATWTYHVVKMSTRRLLDHLVGPRLVRRLWALQKQGLKRDP
ncbi:glycosyltransferase [Zavarzinia sp. CC-PAN008]|uniref:glycosyltransferase family 2 protein n=1 Tax=Zavarzinia sp. CC-PAN008 TaxID=3243332 RepID=UPI003F74A15B